MSQYHINVDIFMMNVPSYFWSCTTSNLHLTHRIGKTYFYVLVSTIIRLHDIFVDPFEIHDLVNEVLFLE